MFCTQAEDGRLGTSKDAREQRHDCESRCGRKAQPVGYAESGYLLAIRTVCVACASAGKGLAHVVSPAAKRQWRTYSRAYRGTPRPNQPPALPSPPARTPTHLAPGSERWE